MLKLSVIIVSWNTKEKLEENLIELFKSKVNFDFEVFVVDNNSFDDSTEMVEEKFSEVKLIKNKENFGFAKANNQAIKKAKGEYVLLLNPDMKVFSDTLENIIKWMDENKQASLAGCKLVNKEGEIIKHVRKFPTFFNQLMIILKIPHVLPFVLNNYLQKNFDYSKTEKVDSIRGAFFMMRTNHDENENISLLLDERYFLWFEEVDFCKQLKKKNKEVWYTPIAKCTDYIGQSFGQVPRGVTQKYFKNSQLKYFKKWHSWIEYQVLSLAWIFGILISKLKIKSRTKT
ncbi:glycosyltransferase family 2 protein [Candidatus Parcubacteria bacterium]|nr:glycosyltransferase family 2 protein [Candidatus Parcubacteria bacterium]